MHHLNKILGKIGTVTHLVNSEPPGLLQQVQSYRSCCTLDLKTSSNAEDHTSEGFDLKS